MTAEERFLNNAKQLHAAMSDKGHAVSENEALALTFVGKLVEMDLAGMTLDAEDEKAAKDFVARLLA